MALAWKSRLLRTLVGTRRSMTVVDARVLAGGRADAGGGDVKTRLFRWRRLVATVSVLSVVSVLLEAVSLL